MMLFPSHLKSSRAVLAAALTATLALSACDRDRADDAATKAPAPVVTAPTTPPPVAMTPPVATPTSAVRVSAVTLGTSAGADLRIPVPMTAFASSDPIIVSIDTSGAANNAELTTRLMYQGGQTAGEQTERITSSGDETTNMTFTNANGWPTGNYRAEIWVDGNQAQVREFAIR